MTVYITLRRYADKYAKYRRPCMQVPLLITGNLSRLYVVFRTQNTGVSVRSTHVRRIPTPFIELGISHLLSVVTDIT